MLGRSRKTNTLRNPVKCFSYTAVQSITYAFHSQDLPYTRRGSVNLFEPNNFRTEGKCKTFISLNPINYFYPPCIK